MGPSIKMGVEGSGYSGVSIIKGGIVLLLLIWTMAFGLVKKESKKRKWN